MFGRKRPSVLLLGEGVVDSAMPNSSYPGPSTSGLPMTSSVKAGNNPGGSGVTVRGVVVPDRRSMNELRAGSVFKDVHMRTVPS